MRSPVEYDLTACRTASLANVVHLHHGSLRPPIGGFDAGGSKEGFHAAPSTDSAVSSISSVDVPHHYDLGWHGKQAIRIYHSDEGNRMPLRLAFRMLRTTTWPMHQGLLGIQSTNARS